MKITKEQEERILALDENFFKSKLEVGKWYKREGYLMVWNNGKNTYGFYNGTYDNFWNLSSTEDLILATNQEVEDALFSEAKKRGYKKGNYVCLINKKVELYAGYLISYNHYNNNLWIENGCVFQNGEWAEITETITKAEAEKLLNKIII